MGEKLFTIIKEFIEKGKVVYTCWEYPVDFGMFYKVKGSNIPFGVDILKSRRRRLKLGIGKLIRKKEKLEALLAGKNLENAQLNESNPKRANKFITKEELF